jgi:hypothetical protein
MEKSWPILTLASGQNLTIKSVTLYDERQVQEMVILISKAFENLGGPALGLGVMGSPEFVVGGAAAIGVVQGLLKSALRERGIAQLTELQEKVAALYEAGHTFPPAEIANIDRPDPMSWFALERRLVPPTNQAPSKTFGLQPAARNNQDLRYEVRYVDSSEDFITIGSDIGLLRLRWSSVVAYLPPQ